MVSKLVRVTRKVYADYVTLDLQQYGLIHGLIEEFGGRVKQFSQDLKHVDDWLIFYEMDKSQKAEFNAAVDEALGYAKPKTV